ncbi:hypothetical protein C4N21_11320 [Faecalibacterium prausnitzii]|uniref:Uncharacterized protein n=1 Tax=Faecalibacterium prausnitzii TaxID=853 RepID=A0A329URH8_9FIRM|nr:hypothetical protein C4N21_11320 [Faecalibacterium prausnitzii]
MKMASACALAIMSGIGFLFGIQKSLRAFLNPLFTGGFTPPLLPAYGSRPYRRGSGAFRE